MKRNLLACVAGVLLLGSIAAPVSAQETKIAIGHGFTFDCLPAFVATDEGIFTKHGLDVTLTPIAQSPDIPAALVSGSIQIGMGSAPVLIQAADAGLDLVVIAGATRMLKGHEFVSLVAPADSGIKGAADLRGKKVGVPGLTSGIAIFLQKWLLDNKVPLAEVKLVESPPPQMKGLLSTHIIDAVTAMEPIRSSILSDGTGVIAYQFYGEVNPDSPAIFWMATAAWSKSHGDAIRAFRAGLADGLAWVRANPDKAADIEKQHLHVTIASLPDFSDVVTPADLQFFVDVAKQLGKQQNPIDVTKLLYHPS